MADPLLFNPHTYDPAHFDPETRRLLRATVDWFEARGKRKLIEDYRTRAWLADFLAFSAKEGLFATFLTPAPAAGPDESDKRWDTARIAALNEIFGFYGLDYWYAWQVTVLGLGPVWQSDNAAARARAAELLSEGEVFAFGLSEKTHGADIYSTDMLLTPDGDGGFRATGSKYYIGNGNAAGLVSVFGRRTDVEGPDGYVFFAADSRHADYHVVKNVVDSSKYVSEFRLEGYPVRAEDVLHTGRAAFDAALNTVNVGKFNLCTASIGICEHAMYEAVTHAHNRILYGRPVTAFPHVRRELADAYVRLVGMKLFSDRAVDYFRSAGPDDRRYLLFNPMTKMKVTTEGEKVIDLMWDVIAAKGFEKDTYFAQAAVEIRGLPKLEGTVHVNLALILKFMRNHLLEAGRVRSRPDPSRRGRRRLPVPSGTGPRSRLRTVPRLAPRLRRLRRGAERRALPRTGRRPVRVRGHRRPRRDAEPRPRLPPLRGPAVRPGRARPADPGAGPPDGPGRVRARRTVLRPRP